MITETRQQEIQRQVDNEQIVYIDTQEEEEFAYNAYRKRGYPDEDASLMISNREIISGRVKCPKCLNKMQCVTKSGSPTKLNGGTIYVAEDMRHATEVYDTISEWECPDCGCRIYLSDSKPGADTPDELDTMG
jgi:hypothetical protein